MGDKQKTAREALFDILRVKGKDPSFRRRIEHPILTSKMDDIVNGWKSRCEQHNVPEHEHFAELLTEIIGGYVYTMAHNVDVETFYNVIEQPLIETLTAVMYATGYLNKEKLEDDGRPAFNLRVSGPETIQ